MNFLFSNNASTPLITMEKGIPSKKTLLKLFTPEITPTILGAMYKIWHNLNYENNPSNLFDPSLFDAVVSELQYHKYLNYSKLIVLIIYILHGSTWVKSGSFDPNKHLWNARKMEILMMTDTDKSIYMICAKVLQNFAQNPKYEKVNQLAELFENLQL